MSGKAAITGEAEWLKRYAGPGILALQDGRTFSGMCFGARRGVDNPVCGEVVFNTSMYGYQEILSDPSYAGQIITFTYPHIGNVGCNEQDLESSRIFAEGLIIRELSRVVSNYRSETSLPRWLEQAGIMGISGLDTRALVSHIRDNGAQMGVIACGDNLKPDELVDRAKSLSGMLGRDYVSTVSCREPYTWHELPWSHKRQGFDSLTQEQLVSRPHVIALDCGIEHNILRLLLDAGFKVTVVPAFYTEQQISAMRPDAIFLSNGPGDPAALQPIVKCVSSLLGKYPIFGICLGHQILAQAVGARTFKLKFGHRGGNHPVLISETGRVEITVQNHGFAVDADSLSKAVLPTHVNLNDRTNEGLRVLDGRAFSVQYHPEACPGPHDARHYFREFYKMVVE